VLLDYLTFAFDAVDHTKVLIDFMSRILSAAQHATVLPATFLTMLDGPLLVKLFAANQTVYRRF
jgi:hypothetical protein